MTEAGRKRVAGRTTDPVRAAREWQRTHEWPRDADYYEREVRPAVDRVTPGTLAQATGLSVAYCRQLKRGQAVAHPMWWEALLGAGAGAVRDR